MSGNREEDTGQKSPDVWQCAWKKVPTRLRPVVLFIVFLALIVAFVLSVAKNLKDVLPEPVNPTPTPVIEWSQSRTVSPLGQSMYDGCIYDAHLLSIQYLDEVLSLGSTADQEAKVREHGAPIAPVTWSSVLVSPASESDPLAVTEFSLRIEDYKPLTAPVAIMLVTGPCANGQVVEKHHMGPLLISPHQDTYDVLHPRTTSPPTAGVVVSTSAEGFNVDINALEPGVYRLRIAVECVLGGHIIRSQAPPFSIAVPSRRTVSLLYSSGWGYPFGVGDPLQDAWDFLDAYWARQARYIKMEFVGYGETAEGLRGQYTYLVNVGATIDLTGWTLATETGEVYYTFPKFVLEAGSGVRVWKGEGTDTISDLFGAADVLTGTKDSPFLVKLLDTSMDWVSSCWVNPKFDR